MKKGRDFYEYAGNCCRTCWVARQKEWRKKNYKRWNRQNHRRVTMRKYGLSADQYDKLFNKDTRCTTCGTKERLCADHKKGTKHLRGILCHKCNLTLGTAKESSTILRALANYIDTCF